MANTEDTFEGNVAAASGAFAGDYLWSNAANWSTARPPVNGDDVVQDADGGDNDLNIDDLNALSLSSLTLKTDDTTQLTGESLTIGTVIQDGIGILEAVSVGQKNVKVTINSIVAKSGFGGYVADGIGAALLDQATSDPGSAQFDVDHGGEVTFACAPVSTTEFDYNSGDASGLFVFENPGTVINAKLADVGLGDELEVPGTFTVVNTSPGAETVAGAVRDIVLSAHSIVVTTTNGTYDFTNVTYADGVKGYNAQIDGNTGLTRITFNDIDSFQQNIAASGSYLWSNVANWTGGVPGTAGAFTVGAAGVDDLARLLLVNLTLDKSSAEPDILVTGATLSVADLLETDPAGTALLEADAADAGKPVAVTLFENNAHGMTFEAKGAGASFEDQSVFGTIASTYAADDGGRVELLNAPLASDVFVYGTHATFALPGVGADNLALIEGLRGGDVLEVPGASVTSVALGASSVGITTSAGSYAFDDVNFAEPIINYTAAYDASTGLEAITFHGVDVFTPKVTDANGDYLWSNAANWSEGVPADGDSVRINETTIDSYGDIVAVGIPNVDDIAALTLSSLVLGTGVDITGGMLAIGTVGAVSGEAGVQVNIDADAAESGAPVTVSVSRNSIAGGFYSADGPGARFIDNTPVDPATGSLPIYAGYYAAFNGGFIEIPGPQAAEDLGYTNSPTGGLGYGLGALAFTAPATRSYTPLIGVTPGDVLELPGSRVSAVSFDFVSVIFQSETISLDSSITITTDAGAYTFLEVKSASPIGSYSWADDPVTGLVAMTFGAPNVFSGVARAESGPLAGDFLWSNPANWSEGPPLPGGMASFASGAIGYDDFSSLSLGGLNLNGGKVVVTGASLALGGVTGGTLVADATDTQGTVTVSISATSTGDTYSADGAGATLLDLSPYDLGNGFTASSGGLVEFAGTLTSLSTLDYDGLATIALANPGTLIAADLNIQTGDVLELPGDVVKSVRFGTGSLTIATNEDTFSFSNVADALDGYAASFDAGTGLEAITLTGVDAFSDNVKAAGGPLAGDYLWSNPANWSEGVPVDGSDVSMAIGASAVDDIAALSLGSLTLNGGTLSVTGGSLAVGVMNDVEREIDSYGIIPPPAENAGSTYTSQTFFVSSIVADSTEAGNPVAVSIGNIPGGDYGADYSAKGAGASLQISSNGPYKIYVAKDGGLIAFTGTIAASSQIAPEGYATLALNNPGPLIAAELAIVPGSVLELPESEVGAVSFGADSLTIATNDGTYRFSGFSNDFAVADYTTAFDSATGLEAITFTGRVIPALHAAAGQHDVIFANVAVTNPVIAGGTVELASGSTVTGNISFSGTGGLLVVDANPDGSTTIPANPITGFAAGDTIELAGVAFSGTSNDFGAPGVDSYTVASPGTLTIDAVGTIYELNIAGAKIGQSDFVLSNDLQVTEVTCFAAGTRIATPFGDAAVEALQIGDLVETLHAGLKKIKWIGTRTYDGRFIAGNKIALPICIRASAIGTNIPARDLWVSPGHAICIGGVLIHASRLVNGVSIFQAEQVDSVSYYHIELEDHEIIFAENCPAETFMGEHFRGLFQNGPEFERLYPGSAAPETRCLPRLDHGFQLEAVRRHLAKRAGIQAFGTQGALRGYVDRAGPEICSGWAQDCANPENPVCLDIVADGRRIGRVLANRYRADVGAAGYGSGCHGFEFPLPAGFDGRIAVMRSQDHSPLIWTETAMAPAA
jgi:hypothetical protein